MLLGYNRDSPQEGPVHILYTYLSNALPYYKYYCPGLHIWAQSLKGVWLLRYQLGQLSLDRNETRAYAHNRCCWEPLAYLPIRTQAYTHQTQGTLLCPKWWNPVCCCWLNHPQYLGNLALRIWCRGMNLGSSYCTLCCTQNPHPHFDSWIKP